MNYYDHILNKSGCACQPLLSAWEADIELDRLRRVVAAQAR